jgi:flagellar hook protein FlgE
VGVLSFDEAGNLVDRNGNMVLGFQLDPTTRNPRLDANGTTSAQNLAPIQVSPEELDRYTGISIGQNGEITAIREGDPAITLGADTGWIRTATLPATSYIIREITIESATADTTAVDLAAPVKPDGTAYSGTFNISSAADVMGPLTLTYDGTNVTLTGTAKNGSSLPAITPVAWDGAGADTLTFVVGGQNINLTVDSTGAAGPNLVSGTPTVVGTVVPNSVTLNISTFNKSGEAVTATGTLDLPANTLVIGDITLTVNPAAFGTMNIGALAGTVMGSAGPGPGVPER